MRPALPIVMLFAFAAIRCGSAAQKTDASSSSPASVAQAAAAGEDPGEYGPGLNQVHVVRTLTIRITGGHTENVTGKKEDGHTTLSGGCKPDLFANLSFDIDKGIFSGERRGIAFVSEAPITMGQTGAIDLDWVLVDLLTVINGNPESKRFKSDGGTLTLTTHDPSKGRRRMVGTIVAKDLEPLDGLKSKPVDVEAAFDADFSCGVK
jgi:hypothetical protein